MDKSRFRFSSEIRVRNFEIDWQGVVHNAVYIQYFETGRIDYLKNLGVKVDTDAINRESKIVIVRSELDYKSPAKFDDLLKVFTRISRIGNTSFTFEGIIENAGTGQLIAESLGNLSGLIRKRVSQSASMKIFGFLCINTRERIWNYRIILPKAEYCDNEGHYGLFLYVLAIDIGNHYIIKPSIK
jgi:acyl-CoA thioester hydrolase